MEIGSFIELDIRKSGEYHGAENDILRLNSARAGIYHAVRLYDCKRIYMPWYQCPTVSDFLTRKGIEIEYYSIDKLFEPHGVNQKTDSAFLVVNYFGVLSEEKIKTIRNRFRNVIVDNSAAFYMPPLNGTICVYSARKFFGVPDGCYVAGENVHKFSDEYSVDYSSDTAAFLLKRIEHGSTAVYVERMKNEARIDASDIKIMSGLSQSLLCGIDYKGIAQKRKVNFEYAHSLYKDINLIDPTQFLSSDNVPMVYPLVVEDRMLMEKLREKKIYTGRWWNSVLKNVPEDSFEAFLSSYMLPIPIDQRYSEKEIEYVFENIKELI